MSFKISKITGKWYNENNEEISLDTNTQSGLNVDSWLKEGNEPIIFEGTPEEITENQQKQVLANETEKYKKRTQDGINAYAEISAEFRLAKLAGIITEQQHGAIESMLIPVRNEVLAGQWISAKQKLEEIGVVIGADLYNRLHNQITNYINENY